MPAGRLLFHDDGMRKWLALLIACLALGLLAVGCGGDDDDGGGDGGAATQQQDRGGAEVVMRSSQFEPRNVTVKAGESIAWVNDDPVPHDVEGSGPGGEFSSGPPGGMAEGDRFSFTFEQPGEYEYVCRVHAPGMAGTVTVK
jgi:plastocyanin